MPCPTGRIQHHGANSCRKFGTTTEPQLQLINYLPPPPLILARAEHPISRKSIDPDALRVLYRLHNNGFAAYLVGGCVRDLLLGKAPKDFDIATDAQPRQVRELFRNSRLIGRRFRLAHVYFPGGKYIEVSTFRRRSEIFDDSNGNGEDPPESENSFGTPAEDAFRRDITINGIFYNLADFSLVDHVGGLEDLRRGLIRCIGDPEEKFVQDPVRMIRVIRHAARNGFPIEETTYRSLLSHVDKIRLCSPARVRDEFLRELREGSARESMGLMIETGMLFALFPSFLEPLSQEERRNDFLGFAHALDALRNSEEPIPDGFYLALFLLPLLDHFCPAAQFSSDRKGRSDLTSLIREWVMETLGPLHFTRGAKEAVAQLLGSQQIFHDFPHGKIPFRLTRKPIFQAALRLHEVATQVRGGEPLRFSLPSEEKNTYRRRKRRSRRNRGRHFRNPGGKENPAGHSTS